MKDVLIAKKEKYLTLAEQIKLDNNDAQIEAEVAKFKESLIQKYAKEKDAKLAKVDVYIELLDELISDYDNQQINNTENNVISENNILEEEVNDELNNC